VLKITYYAFFFYFVVIIETFNSIESLIEISRMSSTIGTDF